MVALSATYSSKEVQLHWNSIIALCGWGEFANTISAVRTGLLRELLNAFVSFWAGWWFSFSSHSSSLSPLWILFVRIQGERFWLQFDFSRQTLHTECCLSKALLFPGSDFQYTMLNTSMRKLGNVSAELGLSHRNLRAPWRLLWWSSQLFLLSLKQTEVPVSEFPAVSEKLILSLIV